MNIFERLIRGDDLRKTRFHDEKGNLVDWVGMTYAPRSLMGSLLRLGFNYRPILPWISYRAIAELEALIQKDWQVLEFGSGMSTLWLAQRCGFIHSIEHDPVWYEKMSQLIQQQQLTNIKYEYRERNGYDDISEYADGFFDFILVDGARRDKCVTAALRKIKPSGYIYLDNCDKEGIRVAETLLLEAVQARHGKSKHFLDFVPCQLVATQGLLAGF